MGPHVHQCRRCHPERFPRIPEPGAPYIALDNGIGLIPEWATRVGAHPAHGFRVEFNGTEPWRGPDGWCITEALAGEMSWIVRDLWGNRWRHCFWKHACRRPNRWGGVAFLVCQRAEYGRVVLYGPDGLVLDGRDVERAG